MNKVDECYHQRWQLEQVPGVRAELVKMLLMAPLGRQQRSQGDQGLSCWCCQCHSVLLLAICIWNAGPRLHLCQLLGKEPAVCHGLTSTARQVEEGGWQSLSQAGGQEGAAKVPRKQVIPPTLLPWQITLPVCSVAQSYLPRLPSPAGDTGSEPGSWSSWGSLPSFYSGALPN